MNRKGILPLTMIIISTILGLILLVVFAKAMEGQSIIMPGSSNNKVECVVGLESPAFGSPEISSIDCNIVGKCGLSFSILPDVLLEKGNVKLIINNVVKDNAKYELTKVFGEEKKVLSACTLESKGTIRLTDDTGSILESKEVSW